MEVISVKTRQRRTFVKPRHPANRFWRRLRRAWHDRIRSPLGSNSGVRPTRRRSLAPPPLLRTLLIATTLVAVALGIVVASS